MGKLIGVGPVKNFFPYVPNTLIVQDSSISFRVIRRDSRRVVDEVTVDSILIKPEMCLLDKAPEYREGHWVAIAENGYYWISKEKEPQWRAQEAKNLKQKAARAKDPAVAYDLLKASAHMIQIDIEELTARLNEDKKPGESLDETYQRVKEKIGDNLPKS